jgi:hypothetical protein
MQHNSKLTIWWIPENPPDAAMKLKQNIKQIHLGGTQILKFLYSLIHVLLMKVLIWCPTVHSQLNLAKQTVFWSPKHLGQQMKECWTIPFMESKWTKLHQFIIGQRFLLLAWLEDEAFSLITLSSWPDAKRRLLQFVDLWKILEGTRSLSSPPEASYPSLVDLDSGIPLWETAPAADKPVSRLASSGPDEETRNGWISGESKLLSGEEATIPAELDIARLVWKALRASSWRGAKLVDDSLNPFSTSLTETVGRGSRGRSAGRRTRLLARLLLLSGLGTIRRPLLPKLLSGSRPKGASRLIIGCKILDFFLASAAAFETSSPFNRANVHGLIFTAPGFLFLICSSRDIFPNELTDAVSGGTTSNCKKYRNYSSINKQNHMILACYNISVNGHRNHHSVHN